MKLYIAPLSPSCRKILALVKYLELEVEIVTLNFQTGDMQKEEFLKMNPTGKVPVFEDDGFYVWESNAIMEYLCRSYGGEEIYPPDLMSSAMIKQWLFFEAAHFNEALNIVVYEGYIKPHFNLGPVQQEYLNIGTRDAHRYCKVLDTHLKDKDFVCSDLSVADFALACQIENAQAANFPMSQYPNILKWNEKMKTIPAWLQTRPQSQ